MRVTLSFTLYLLLGATLLTQAQENYDTAKIPAGLLKNSTAVIRNEEHKLIVKSSGKATFSYKTAVTILSRGGEDKAAMSEYYDQFSSVYNLKAAMYDAKGVKIKTYKSADFKDESITSSGTMYDGSRTKKLDFLNNVYPYTIEYSYDKDYNGYVSYPSWYPVASYDCAVEKSVFTFQLPAALTFRYRKGKNLKTDSVTTGNTIVYNWACNNLPAFAYEPLSTGLETITPWITLSPDKFEYDNTLGSVDNWKNLGQWIYGLSGDIYALPEKTKSVVKELTANAKTDKEKIEILYKYLQSNTRYVSVQLGIGGFKPIPAEKVATVNYGDCKALSNYMKALLAEAGIKSNLVILGSGKPSLNADYASFGQANHMILCVPAAKDTTWLECTSQYVPMGYITTSNADRKVLLITDNGGKLVKTPVYNPQDNYQKSKINVALTTEGKTDVQLHIVYGAAQYEDQLGMMLTEPVNQRKRLMSNMRLPEMEISSVSFVQPDKRVPVIEENMAFKTGQLMNNGDDKLFLTLNLLNRKESVPEKAENRKTPFSVPYGYHDTDEISYTLPAGYKVEFIPKDVVLESEFGKYTAQTVVKDGKIIYTRSQLAKSNTYAPEKYNDLIAFYKKIYQADKQKAVLAKIN